MLTFERHCRRSRLDKRTCSQRGDKVKRTTLGLAIIAVTTMLLSGCGSGNGSTQGGPIGGEEATNTQTGPEDTEEQEAVKSHDALAPEDYIDRLLSLADVPDTLSMEEEGQFGDPVEGLSSNKGGTEDDRYLAECAMNQYVTVVQEAPDTTAYRTFSESSQSSSIGIVTSLSKPAKNPDAVKDTIDSAISECMLLDPKTAAGNPIESVDTFEPSGTKGEGICTTAFDGISGGQDRTLVGTTCFVSWADEILAISYSAGIPGASSSVDQTAVDGVQKLMESEILPTAFQKSGFAE